MLRLFLMKYHNNDAPLMTDDTTFQMRNRAIYFNTAFETTQTNTFIIITRAFASPNKYKRKSTSIVF